MVDMLHCKAGSKMQFARACRRACSPLSCVTNLLCWSEKGGNMVPMQPTVDKSAKSAAGDNICPVVLHSIAILSQLPVIEDHAYVTVITNETMTNCSSQFNFVRLHC